MKHRLSSLLVDLTVLTLGILSLLAPFLFEGARDASFSSTAFPLMVSLILVLCILLVLFSTQAEGMDSKLIAFLGVLIAINAGIRFLENALPGPAGFSPTFFLIIMVGYIFGGHLGFLMGVMTMFVSGLITGGIGPWLPGQMITAGWVGQSAALLRPIILGLKWNGRKPEVILLAIFSAAWGLLYGLVMNLWFWPFLAGTSGQSWLPSGEFMTNIQRYSAYYLATSVIWDVTRAFGNILVILAMSRPVLKLLLRFKARFTFSYEKTGTL